MSVEADFDELVGEANSAMAIVTTAADGERSGCLVGFHGQISIKPRLYGIWISRENHTFAFIDRAPAYAVHLLDVDDHPLAELFGGATADDLVDKFTRCRWSEGPDGVPLLDDAPSWFVGRVLATHDVGGDHVLVVLHPTLASVGAPFSPLRLGDATDIEPGHPVTGDGP